MANKEYNWDLIKMAFIQGLKDKEGNRIQATLKEVADHFKVNYYQVRRKSSQENWKILRKKHYKVLAEKRTEKQAEIQAYNGALLDSKVVKAAKIGIDTIRSYFLNQKTEALKAIKENKDIPLLRTTELVKLSTALLNFQKAYKLAVGESTENFGDSKLVLELKQKTSSLTQDEQQQFKEIAFRLSKEMGHNGNGREYS
jgi:hypothetical protein